MRRHRRAAPWLATAAAAAACAHLPGGSRAVPDCPGAWASTREIPGDFLLRQRLLVTHADRVVSLQLVVQKSGDELLLLGLHPLGARLFTVRQRGLETSVDAAPPAILEVPPLNVLRDLHRALFLGVAAAAPDGRSSERRDGTEIRELRERGRVLRRTFRRLDADPPGLVALDFEPASERGGPRVEIENGWCGYRAELTTLSEEALP